MSLPATVSSGSKPNNFDEHRWVIQIRQTLDEVPEEDANVTVSIFNVPKILMATNPECYIPQQIAFGPCHYFRPEMYEMERYKLAAAKRAQNQLENLKFEHLVEKLRKFEPRIRACYHRYLSFSGETLGWMMAVDACFLLEFLQVYAVKEGQVLRRGSSRMSHLLDATGGKSAHNAILRDMAMLENQIPMFLLRKMLKFQLSSSQLADDMLLSMLVGLCKELLPFKMTEHLPNVQVKNRAHVLDFLYHMIVPETEELPEIFEVEERKNEEENEGGSKTFGESSHVKQLLHMIYKHLSKLNHGLVHILKRVLSKPVKLIVKLPWTILSKLPGIKILKKPLEVLFSSADDNNKGKLENEDSGISKPPLVEKISIPSVTDLLKSGVYFSPTNGGVMDISFDNKTFTLYLPVVSLDVNTGVILRNLVAYEACKASGPLVFTRYTELMNGIIDTEEDAKFLRERGIIVNRLKSDEEVANLWNGMSKSIKLTKVPFLDKVIEDVNKYHSGRWKVKVRNFMKVYVFGSWQCLTLLATIMMLCLMTLQAFCSVYTCARVFHIEEFQ
ncbi:hypothetical protein LguiB_026746 [Lonicera macranthoides]